MTQREKDIRFLQVSRVTYVAAFALLITMAVAANSGCSTVTPKRVDSSQASFDGNAQNSGVLGFNDDGSGHITAHARDRYNDLIRVYGRQFAPALKADDGIIALPDGTFNIDAQHLVAFGQMAATRRAGILPKQ